MGRQPWALSLPDTSAPYHPSGSSQCTSPKHPVSCIEPGLVTRFIYDIIHVSMPFSHIFPPGTAGPGGLPSMARGEDWASQAQPKGKAEIPVVTVGEGEGGMIWENGIETCIISYMKRVASPGSMQHTGRLGLVHWDDPEGWYWEGGGRREEGSGWLNCTSISGEY